MTTTNDPQQQQQQRIVDMPSIWCPECQDIAPLIVDFLAAADLNDHAAQDLVCGRCHFIIATLHARPTP